jgi:hypothetical protein
MLIEAKVPCFRCDYLAVGEKGFLHCPRCGVIIVPPSICQTYVAGAICFGFKQKETDYFIQA